MASGKKTKQEIAAELAEFNEKYQVIQGDIEGIPVVYSSDEKEKNRWKELVNTAIYYDNAEVLLRLIQDRSCHNKSETTDILTGELLKYAISSVSLKSVRCLLEYSKDLMPADTFKKMIHDVIYDMIYRMGGGSRKYSHIPEVLRLFAEYGYDINKISTDKYGAPDSVAHEAARQGKYGFLYSVMKDKDFDIKKMIGIDGGYSFIYKILNGGFYSDCQDIKIKLVQRILEEKDVLDLSKRPEDKPSLICCAIRGDFSDFTSFCLIKMLLEAGVSLEKNNREKDSPMNAIATSKNEALQKFINDYSGINCVVKLTSSQKRLFKAVIDNNITDLKNELARGVDVNTIKNPLVNRITALHVAALQYVNKDILQVLLEAGADPNIKDINGNTPITLIRGLDPYHYYNARYNGVRLGWDVKTGSVEDTKECIKILIAAGAEDPPNIRNIIENIRLKSSIGKTGCIGKTDDGIITDIVSMSVNAGYKIDIQELLAQCISYRLAGTAKFLIDSGADVNMPLDKNQPFKIYGKIYGDMQGKSLVFAAAAQGDIDMVELLINNGADPTVKEFDNMSAIDAFISEYPDRKDCLKAVLFKISQKNNLAIEDRDMSVSSAVDFNI